MVTITRTPPIPKAFADLGYSVEEYDGDASVCFKDKEIAITAANTEAILEVVVRHFMRIAGIGEHYD